MAQHTPCAPINYMTITPKNYCFGNKYSAAAAAAAAYYVHREAEKRNQFSFVCIFLMLDRNW